MPPKGRAGRKSASVSVAVTPLDSEMEDDKSVEDKQTTKGKGKGKNASSQKGGRSSIESGKSPTKVNGKRKRKATSDEGSGSEDELLIGKKPPVPSGKKPYVLIERRVSGLSQASSGTTRSQSSIAENRRSALSSFARSRRTTNASTPATSEPSHSSDGEILTDDSLQFKDVSSSDEEQSASEFEEDSLSDASQLAIGDMSLSDNDEESQPVVTTRSGRQTPAKSTSGTKTKQKPKPAKTNGATFKIGGSTFKPSGKKSPVKKEAGRKASIDVDEDNVMMEWGGQSQSQGQDEADDTDEEMMKAAIQASYVTAAQEITASLQSAGAGPSASGSRSTRMSMSISPAKRTTGTRVIDSDSESDVPLATKSKSKSTKGKKGDSKSKSKSKAKSPRKKTKGKLAKDEDDDDVIDLSSSGSDFVGSAMDVDDDDSSVSDELSVVADEVSSDDDEIEIVAVKKAWPKRGPLTAEEMEAKAELKRLEVKERKRLGRKLTYAEKSTIALYRHHPELKTTWGDLEKREVIKPETGVQPPGLKVKLLPFQLESMTWMRKQEEGEWRGGMLADEMGMGKTIQTLGLLVNDRRKPNLVVAPTVAIMQWRNEIDQHTEGFKVNVFHGASRTKDIEDLRKYDVVLTTYAVLESVFRKQNYGFKRKGQVVKEKSMLHEIHWARIILDEAHNIKERSTNTARAAFELQGTYKWCLSGTPLQNRVGELYSLVRFLGGDPFSFYFCKRCDCKSLHWKFTDKRTCDKCGHAPTNHVCLWNNEILSPIQKHGLEGPGRDAFRKLRILLDRMMLRRTKLERADDLGLPPRTVIVRRDYFSPEEKELYLSLFSDAKRQFSTYVDAGTLLNSELGDFWRSFLINNTDYSNIFSLITRMRQMACHPDLVLKSKKNIALSADIVETTVCRICNDIAEDAIESKCHHVFDRECIRQYLAASMGTTPECPVCHLPLTIDLEAEAIELSEEQVNKTKQGILGRLDIDEWRSSSKIEALVEELTTLRSQDRTVKSIVFSQFVNFLDLIAFRLKKAGFNLCRLEGTMSPQARDLTIKHFMNNVDVTVFLVSLKAGGVALNLTEASRVYLMDSWWNPAVEFQAMDRIHRLGQHRPVQAIKLVIEDSIESRIIQLQEKKSAMVDATLSTDDSAMGRLTPEDLGFLFRL
ncbi:hypothetical protein M408DRAFT_266519 [Serendipita vermifera MAFF 305830]|uniref:DNA repair protein RAD16 n=1 Tax=Serendipita vermifera MAFF 305830 TaxID=933852 RepID=A0A0C3AEU6_SERVB|nr:hypothetical protein M408DRAFT_266519 [Serendipita vermifera MAFF 305830]